MVTIRGIHNPAPSLPSIEVMRTAFAKNGHISECRVAVGTNFEIPSVPQSVTLLRADIANSVLQLNDHREIKAKSIFCALGT